MPQAPLQQFYIPEEQSVYLLSQDDARKLKAWVALCQEQLEQLGYRDIELVGKGAYGFVFAGVTALGDQYVFKFTRVNLPQHLQDRLEEEAFMLEQVEHPPGAAADRLSAGAPPVDPGDAARPGAEPRGGSCARGGFRRG